jgi:hypothetical protein
MLESRICTQGYGLQLTGSQALNHTQLFYFMSSSEASNTLQISSEELKL